MGFLKNWWSRIKRKEEDFEGEEGEWKQEPLRRDRIDLHNPKERERYVRACLEQMQEAMGAVESLSGEYAQVTAYLTDIEEIEALPGNEKEQLETNAAAISSLEENRESFLRKKGRMGDERFRQMERMEEELAEGLKKIKSTEDYQNLVKQDLARLDGERHAYVFRQSELRSSLANTRGMMVICACALAACIAMLFILQAAFQMDAQLGYLITAAAAALSATVLYLRNLEAGKELERVNRGINKLIALQNRVKIRYVNNTNLLEYYYMKYNVSSGRELEQLWSRYQEEQEEREKYRQANLELDFYQKELLKQLRRCHIKDPNIWLHQTLALIDGKEMVEIRHGLIVRRQRLRKQMDYNKELADSARAEVKDISEEYPQYTKEILELVSEYDN